MSNAPELVVGHSGVVKSEKDPMGVYVHKESYDEFLRAELVSVLGEDFIEDNCPDLIEELGLEEDDGD